jgi:F-type H+-transporting ATPase subunit epsilon
VAGILQVTVVSATAEVWSGEATMVVARTTEGEIGILAGHEPTLGVLAEG